MLMLLCVHVTRVLFLVLAGNFALYYGLLLELHALTLVARSYALLLVPNILFCTIPILAYSAHNLTYYDVYLEAYLMYS